MTNKSTQTIAQLASIIIFSFLSLSSYSQEINYEVLALEHFIEDVESDSLFQQTCDCKFHQYDTTMLLKVYDSSYYDINPSIAIHKLELNIPDSTLRTQIDTKKVLIQSNTFPNRVTLGQNKLDFNQNQYFIRFSERLILKNQTIIEFNIKPTADCSGLNFFYLFDENGNIIKHQLMVKCDFQD